VCTVVLTEEHRGLEGGNADHVLLYQTVAHGDERYQSRG
jgi:hypothetical protein